MIFLSCEQQAKNNEETDRTITETQTNEQIEKTYAELSVKEGGEWEGREYKGGEFKNVSEVTLPEDHTDHSYYIRYEGPGWESEKVGYRLYLDWRNAIDIFGKTVDTMVLHQVGQSNFDSYHEMSDWGMDILKAGKSMGIGGFGRVVADSVAHFRSVQETTAKVNNSKSKSGVTITYDDWITASDTIDLQATLSIGPEERTTIATLTPSKEITGLCTGIVDHGLELQQGESENGEWAYIATYGNQTLVNEEDKLGMVLFYQTAQVEEVTNGTDDHLVIFKPTKQPIKYAFAGAWEQEKNGITTEEEFNQYVIQKLEEFATNE